MPENFYDTNTDQGLEYGDGDETVPLTSAQEIISDRMIEIQSTHNDLPTKAQCEIFRELTGESDCEYDEDTHIANMLLFNVFSPIDIQIISPSGKKMGKNFVTGETYDEIPGAYYTGYDTKNEFITVPNPEDGEYRILTQGTGEGEYRIEAVKITEGANPGDVAKESTATFTGTATLGATEEKKIELLADDTVVSKEDKDIIAPVITIASPENKSYLNHQLLPVTYTVTDNISAAEKIMKVVKLDDEAINQTTLDLSLQPLGTRILTIQATDEAGNAATATVSFENTVTWVSLNKNILHYSALGLIKKKETVNHIAAYLKYFKATQDFRARLERLPYLPPHIKARLIQNFQREQQRTKEIFFRYLEKESQKGVIDSQAQERIVEAVEMLVQ